MKYIILQLILNAATGEPLELPTQYNSTEYDTYDACETAKADIGPQTASDGKVKVFACATEKKVTHL